MASAGIRKARGLPEKEVEGHSARKLYATRGPTAMGESHVLRAAGPQRSRGDSRVSAAARERSAGAAFKASDRAARAASVRPAAASSSASWKRASAKSPSWG